MYRKILRELTCENDSQSETRIDARGAGLARKAEKAWFATIVLFEARRPDECVKPRIERAVRV